MSPDDLTNALVNAIIAGGRQWVVSTIAALLPSMWVMTIILHLARPAVFRTIRKLSLRFGADIWWLGYVLVRDGVILITFALSVIFLFPNLALTIDLPLTAPIAGLLLFASLYVKLLYDSDDDLRTYRVATLLLAVGAGFYLIPQIFAIESADVLRPDWGPDLPAGRSPGQPVRREGRGGRHRNRGVNHATDATTNVVQTGHPPSCGCLCRVGYRVCVRSNAVRCVVVGRQKSVRFKLPCRRHDGVRLGSVG